MRVFKTRPFERFAARNGISDLMLCDAIDRATAGLVDAHLGGGVIKQRIARDGGGRSGGFRTIILLRSGSLAFFIYGFAKNERDNIRRDELAAFRQLATTMLSLDPIGIGRAVANGTITEVNCDA